MAVQLWLSIILLPILTAAFDPSISNGTCYFGPNQKASSNYIPCGNAAGGVQTCCQARDYCLSSDACYNSQYGVTYLAGCTDKDYNDAKCPNKGSFTDHPWVGLVRCFVSNTNDEEWAGCSGAILATVSKSNNQCKCTASSSTALFTDAAVLTNIASLPVSVGNAIAWSSGYEPSTTISDPTSTGTGVTTSTATSRSNTAVPGTSVISAIPTFTSLPDSSSSDLSTAAKAGIGVGTAGGVLAIAALLLWFGWFRRRRRNRSVPPISDQIRPNSNANWGFEDGPFTDKTGLAAVNRQSWGVKSELPTEANEITTTKTSLGENTVRTTPNTPATTYLPYQRSPTVAASEMDASPTGSTSRLAPGNTTPRHPGPIYEMPG